MPKLPTPDRRPVPAMRLRCRLGDLPALAALELQLRENERLTLSGIPT